MRPVMYIFANKGLGMSAPKMAGMVLQAGILAYRGTRADLNKDDLMDAWISGGMMKVVLEAEDTEQLHNIDTYIKDHGFTTYPVIDEGRTEVRPFSFTTLGVELVDKDDPTVAAVFSQFKTYREDKPPVIETKSGSWREQMTALWKSTGRDTL